MFGNVTRSNPATRTSGGDHRRPSPLLLVLGGMVAGAVGVCWLAHSRTRNRQRHASNQHSTQATMIANRPSRAAAANAGNAAQSGGDDDPVIAENRMPEAAPEMAADPDLIAEDILIEAGVAGNAADTGIDAPLVRGPVTQDSSVIEAVYADRNEEPQGAEDPLDEPGFEDQLQR